MTVVFDEDVQLANAGSLSVSAGDDCTPGGALGFGTGSDLDDVSDTVTVSLGDIMRVDASVDILGPGAYSYMIWDGFVTGSEGLDNEAVGCTAVVLEGNPPPELFPIGARASLPHISIAPDIYGRYAAIPDEASLAVNNGSLTSIVRDPNSDQLLVYRHEPQTLEAVSDPIVISTAGWPRWGGHLAAPDGSHFVLLGRDNLDERSDYDTIEVRRYDADWNLMTNGHFSNDGRGVYQPFRSGAPAMALVDGQLVIHMSRLQFLTTYDGLHHQVNLTLIGDADDLQMRSYKGRPYAGHSFNQLVVPTDDEAGLIFVDHGDAYPRGIQSGITSVADAIDDAPASTDLVLAFDGSLADDFYQYTGTSVTGLDAVDDGAIIIGNSVRHSGTSSRPIDQTENRNVFVLTIDDNGTRRDLHWLTEFPPHDGKTAGDPRLVQLDGGHFVVLFTIFHPDGGRSLGYRLLDGSGRQIASATWPDAHLGAVSEVIADGSNLYWVGSHGGPHTPMFLFELDITDRRSPVLR